MAFANLELVSSKLNAAPTSLPVETKLTLRRASAIPAADAPATVPPIILLHWWRDERGLEGSS
jgi:hypothetical protein